MICIFNKYFPISNLMFINYFMINLYAKMCEFLKCTLYLLIAFENQRHNLFLYEAQILLMKCTINGHKYAKINLYIFGFDMNKIKVSHIQWGPNLDCKLPITGLETYLLFMFCPNWSGYQISFRKLENMKQAFILKVKCLKLILLNFPW